MAHTPTVSPIGAPIKRDLDRQLVIGEGMFVDDIQLPGTLHIVFVRSPYAHAEIASVDVSAAEAADGVVAVVTGADVDAWLHPSKIVEPLLPNRPLVRRSIQPDVVRYVGDAVAAVIAESAVQAVDAAELVEVEYNELPVSTETDAPTDEAVLHPGWESNLAYEQKAGSGDLEAAFAAADHIVELELVLPRVASVYIEPKAGLAAWDHHRNRLSVWASTQTPHGLRTQIATALDMPEDQIHVIAPDVGGAFGTKGRHAPDYLFVAAAAKRLKRPVKWVEERSEYFRIANQGRDQKQRVRGALSKDGKLLGLEVNVFVNCGAYNASTHGGRTLIMSGGAYRYDALSTTVSGVMTNTTPTGPYRGAGRPEAAYMVERFIEEAARVTGIDSIELRRKNFIPADAFPYAAATGVTYDSGNYERALDVALEAFDMPAAEAKLTELRAQGLLAGIGVSVFVEPSGGGWDSAEVRVAPSGAVVVSTGVSPHGQGTDVGIRQIVAAHLGVPVEQVGFRSGDTETTPQGIGTFGSRSLSLGGGAAWVAASRVAEKMKTIAGAMLESSAADVELKDAKAQVIGSPDRSLSFARVAAAAYSGAHVPGGVSGGLEETEFFSTDGSQFPFGVHIAMVSIDPDTGHVRLERFLGVDDCGTVINPRMVEGQVLGGLAQGIGQALFEEVVFDADGQNLTSSLMDYAVPHAEHFPWVELDHTETPSPMTPHGGKGVGEAGTTGAPPAIVNAALNALAQVGVTRIDMPLKPEKVWRAIQDAQGEG